MADPRAVLNAADRTRPSRCSRCGAPFRCGIDEPGGCWCARLPALPASALAEAADCLCPDCLRAAIDRCPP